MNKLIKDSSELAAFIGNYLPELESHERYYLALFARNKYDDSLKSNMRGFRKAVVKKEDIYNTIKQWGAVDYYNDGELIDEKALVVYITPNPRDLQKAALNTALKLVKLVAEPYNGYNPKEIALSQIHKAQSRKVFVNFDFDGYTSPETFVILRNGSIINEEAIKILITRGGFHLLVELSKIDEEYRKTWYKNILNLPGIDGSGHDMIPIPGTNQGGFIPYFLD